MSSLRNFDPKAESPAIPQTTRLVCLSLSISYFLLQHLHFIFRSTDSVQLVPNASKKMKNNLSIQRLRNL